MTDRSIEFIEDIRVSEKMKSVLIVDDESDIRTIYSKKLKLCGYQVHIAEDIREAFSKLSLTQFDVIVLDLFLGDKNGLDYINDFLLKSPQSKIVILTGNGTIDFAVNALNKGAFDFLVKTDLPDTNIAKLKSILEVEHQKPDVKNLNLSQYGIIGESEPIKVLAEKIFKLKDVDSTVLIEGESGTGKELFSRAIHLLSSRSSRPFIAINCAAIAENILESELFGYKKGAFTDARKDRKGYFETCTNGTLFLDEIGEMSASLQSKLLRVLQEKEVTPLGSCTPVPINTRIIAATNRNLKRDIEEKRFREDLYYRLAVFKLTAPSLRERKSDIPLLVDFFIEKFSARFNKQVASVPRGVKERLKAYSWPGNIRELQNAVERAVVLSNEGEILPEDLIPAFDLIDKQSDDLNFPKISDLPLNFQDAKDSFENYYIRNILSIAKGNVAEASRLSGQYRPNIYRLIHKFQLDPHHFKKMSVN